MITGLCRNISVSENLTSMLKTGTIQNQRFLRCNQAIPQWLSEFFFFFCLIKRWHNKHILVEVFGYFDTFLIHTTKKLQIFRQEEILDYSAYTHEKNHLQVTLTMHKSKNHSPYVLRRCQSDVIHFDFHAYQLYPCTSVQHFVHIDISYIQKL